MLWKITYKQQKVLEFYENFIKQNWHYPTYQEASEWLDISPSVVFSHVKNLEKKWYVLIRNEDWAVKVLESTKRIPVLWKVACWQPIDVIEDVSDYIEVSKSMIGSWENFYALEAVGDSMKNIGINTWDILIIRQQSDVNDWEIAVVIDQESDTESATLKRVFHKPWSILLKAENDDFPNILLNKCSIRGKLINIIRKF